MKCPQCSNEVSQGEAFCGQCGTPTTPSMGNIPATQSEQLPKTVQANTPNAPYNTLKAYTPNPRTQAAAQELSNAPAAGEPGNPELRPNQQTGFYHDATEALLLPPGHGNYPQNRGFGGPQAGGYPGTGQYSSPVTPSTENYSVQPSYPPYVQPPYLGRVGQNAPGSYGKPGLSSQRQQHSAIIPIICICLAVAVLSTIGLVTFAITKNQPNTAAQKAVAPTATATPQPTTAPTAVATVAPTPVVDPGFIWCDTACASYNFGVEYPEGWTTISPTNASGTEFVNSTEPDMFAAFKSGGTVSATTTAGDLLSADLQTNYASQSAYIGPLSSQTATISGETWATAVASYQGQTQRERVEVYATVHQQQSYIIEFQAPDSEFDSINSSYYTPMLNKYQFLQ